MSLVARVFKARNFPNDNILNSKRNGGTSFVWSGLWTIKEKIKNDFCWVIDDAKSIYVPTDLWLRMKHNYLVERGEYYMNFNTKVCHFFKTGSKEWDEMRVRGSLDDIDVQAIL